jgi:RNA polymerase sigma factor (sigma-70 family)
MDQTDADEVPVDVKNMLYERFSAPILAYLCQQVSNRQDAEDLLLEVFLAALTTDVFDGLSPKQQLAWLRRVARNKVVDRYRHTQALLMLPLELVRSKEDERLTLEQRAERRETYQHLAQAVRQLSPIQQELLKLRYGQELRLSKIAEIFEKPEGTVRKLLSRTLHQLRQLYEQSERGE